MNYFKAAEQLLAALPELERAVENLKHREDRIVNSGAPKMPAAIDYAKPFADVTSINDTLSERLALTEVQRNRHKTESQIAEIKRILAQMEAEHQALIRMWYVERMPKESIMQSMCIESLKTVYNLRNRAVAQFALLYFGAPALDSV